MSEYRGRSTSELAEMDAEFRTGIQKNRGIAVAILAVLACLPETARIDRKRAHEIAELILKNEPQQSFAGNEAFNAIETVVTWAQVIGSGAGQITLEQPL
jgi:hypothetical protein